ncbi:AraC-like DNA-binding protein [Mesorhizobium soli]|uniref:AraC family transcriptional regulator n=1 Tax=Pseudaminobacter soli (ex Li et al. 2025) TaxID=1295366 RepID=UPI002475D212|nr:AraC family transcriptional regulator [Mesorhizobium soli]MDH6230770.1 AraC-like DNA-binding protein [Mesorhizobium soli]
MEANHRPLSPLRRLDLSPLYRNCVLRSDIRRETYDCIATELCDYGLAWSGGAVEARAYKAQAGSLSIHEIQYGDEVMIKPDLYHDFILAHVSLKNGIEVEADGNITHVPEGACFFSAPQKYVRLRWQEQCRQLLLRIPVDFVWPKGADGRRSAARPGRLLPTALAPVFVDQLNLTLNIADRGIELENYSEWVEQVELGMARFVKLLLLEKTAQPTEAKGARASRNWHEKLESFIHARLKSPLMLDDLTAAVGIGRSQLNNACREAFGCSPMELVRRIRLEAARADLEGLPDQDLTMLALRYGFEHQSRFAQYYRNQFGELPRETRRRLSR